MCLAVPGKILSIAGDDALMRVAKVAFSGVVKEISLALLPDAGLGDYVLVHAGFAIAAIDEAEAAQTIAYLDALSDVSDPSEQVS